MQNSIRDILDVVFRHKFKIVAFFIVFVALVVLYNLVAPEIYESEARLLIRRGRENVSVDPAVEGTTVAMIQNREREVYSELAILRSRQLAEEVVDEIGPDPFLALPAGRIAGVGRGEVIRRVLTLGMAPSLRLHETALRNFEKSLDVEVERKSTIVEVGFEAHDPDLAYRALDRLVELYLQRHIEVHSAKAEPEFFEKQVNALKMELDAAEERLDAFRNEHGISSLELQTEVALAQIRYFEGLVDEATGRMRASEAEVAVLEQAVDRQPTRMEWSRTTGVTNWAADDYKKRLAGLRHQETDLAARYSESYRPLVELRQQIDQLEGTLADEGNTHTQVTTGINDSRKQLEIELERRRAEFDARSAEVAVLAAGLGEYRERHAELATKKVKLASLERDVALAEDEYRRYRQNWEESKISAALDRQNVSNVSVVQPASKPLDPVRPKRVRNVVVGIILGLCGGIALAFFRDYFDDSLKKDSDVVRRLNLPVLASISEDEFRSCT